MKKGKKGLKNAPKIQEIWGKNQDFICLANGKHHAA
mgnify:CR=1 FL=1